MEAANFAHEERGALDTVYHVVWSRMWYTRGLSLSQDISELVLNGTTCPVAVEEDERRVATKYTLGSRER